MRWLVSTGVTLARSLAVVAVMAALAGATPATAQQNKAGQNNKAGQGQPLQVGVDAVRTEPTSQTFPVIGRLVARETGAIATRIAGPVAELRVRVGDRVKAEDIVAVLVKDSLHWQHELQKAEVAKQEAVVRTRKAEIALLNQELGRLEGLKGSSAFPQARHDDKRKELATAQSRLAEAEAELARSRANERLAAINLYNADIRAPYAGVISQRNVEAGAFVGVGQPVVTMVNDTELELEADVPAGRIAALLPGTEVSYRIGDGEPRPAVVRAMVPVENPATRTRLVRFVSKGPAIDAQLAANQSVTLDLPTGIAREVATVHKDAILYRQGGTLVFVVRDGKAEIRPVRLGEAIGSRFEVASGLQPGDVVVVRGNERLRPGQAVAPREVAPPAADTAPPAGAS